MASLVHWQQCRPAFLPPFSINDSCRCHASSLVVSHGQVQTPLQEGSASTRRRGGCSSRRPWRGASFIGPDRAPIGRRSGPYRAVEGQGLPIPPQGWDAQLVWAGTARGDLGPAAAGSPRVGCLLGACRCGSAASHGGGQHDPVRFPRHSGKPDDSCFPWEGRSWRKAPACAAVGGVATTCVVAAHHPAAFSCRESGGRACSEGPAAPYTSRRSPRVTPRCDPPRGLSPAPSPRWSRRHCCTRSRSGARRTPRAVHRVRAHTTHRTPRVSPRAPGHSSLRWRVD